jgi:hypothetical protein
MNKEASQKLLNYHASLSIFKQMLSQGIIAHGDYEKAKELIADKYSLPKQSIYR